MKQCDICQGRGIIILVEKIDYTGVSLTSRGLEPDGYVQHKSEKCPKCDGKGMVNR